MRFPWLTNASRKWTSCGNRILAIVNDTVLLCIIVEHNTVDLYTDKALLSNKWSAGHVETCQSLLLIANRAASEQSSIFCFYNKFYCSSFESRAAQPWTERNREARREAYREKERCYCMPTFQWNHWQNSYSTMNVSSALRLIR